MPIRISNAAAYRSMGPVWVITWAPFRSLLGPLLGHDLGLVWVILYSVIIVLYSDVPTSIYCYVSRYPFPLENVGIRLQL